MIRLALVGKMAGRQAGRQRDDVLQTLAKGSE